MPTHRAIAQDVDQEQQVQDEITVTGSRIIRQDFTANAPITTIDESTFEQTSTIGVETVLNQLPQFVPAVTQFDTSDVQNTAINTLGASTVSLRGLGANRNLVLIDGKRAQPINPTMVVDTNSIPAAAIARVEVISGGASAVYGADAVGGVVNFILKDDFEGATVDITYGDTWDGGNQEVTLSGLIGANAGDRGNVMLGVERSTRSKVHQWERDWRVADDANPNTPATAFFWGSDTWISNVQGTFGNLPSQAFVNNFFGTPDCPPAATFPFDPVCQQNAQGVNLGVPAGTFFGGMTRFLLNRPSGTVYTGLMDNAGAAGAYRYEGPYSGDNFGNFEGLPFRVVQPNGAIKENNYWQWSSIPLERLSSFAKGHFDVSDNVRLTGQAMFTRTEAETSLGLTADLITFWGAEIPYGTTIYTGNTVRGIPSSLTAGGTTHADYLPGGRFGLNCDADGVAGCTESEAWPLPPQMQALLNSRPNPEASAWLNRPPDYIRQALGGSRSGQTTTDTMQLSIGAEGDLPSGNDFWDLTVSTGRTDSLTVQSGSARLSSYRAVMEFPNFGRDAILDPNPYVVGFAESIATCTSGLPVIQDFPISQDCVRMLAPSLKNENALTQTMFEANLVGDLVEMPAGPMGYALGLSYREADFRFVPDNLSLNQNFIDPIAGLFPNEPSDGEFDVSEVYGELLIPIVSDGPAGVEHFSVELGGRISDWSMPEVDKLETYKALIDWGFTPNYRLRGGINRAHRAPNLGELFISRTQIFGGVAAVYQEPCSQNNLTNPISANPNAPGNTPAQATQTYNMCRAQMGPAGAAQYYDSRPISAQPTGVGPFGGGNGIQNSFGNENLQEEQADTFTLGVVMDFLDNWTVTVDYYNIEITDMIAVESPDSTHLRCYGLNFNPTGDINSSACQQIFRNPSNGMPANIDLTYNNQGRVEVSGVDLQLNWSKPLASGGFNLTMLANYNIETKTQDRPGLPERDWQGIMPGIAGCPLQIDCQGYEYRLFTTLNYFRGAWGVTLRHQYWPDILPAGCVAPVNPVTCQTELNAGGGVQEDYQLFALSGQYTFNEKYTLRVGIENLLDEEPPLTGANPNALPFPIAESHIGRGLGAGQGANYDPLGRRGFISMTMDF